MDEVQGARPPARLRVPYLSLLPEGHAERGMRCALSVPSSQSGDRYRLRRIHLVGSGRPTLRCAGSGQLPCLPRSAAQRRVGATRRRAQAELSVALFMRFPVVHFETPPS